MIREAKSPTLVREMLLAYLPEKHRHAAVDAEPVSGLTIGSGAGDGPRRKARLTAAVTAGSSPSRT